MTMLLELAKIKFKLWWQQSVGEDIKLQLEAYHIVLEAAYVQGYLQALKDEEDRSLL